LCGLFYPCTFSRPCPTIFWPVEQTLTHVDLVDAHLVRDDVIEEERNVGVSGHKAEEASSSRVKRQALIPFPRTGKRAAEKRQGLVPFPRTGKRQGLVPFPRTGRAGIVRVVRPQPSWPAPAAAGVNEQTEDLSDVDEERRSMLAALVAASQAAVAAEGDRREDSQSGHGQKL
jgi:hypothetical protein